jgi:membrane-associated phospholipid phosphatase
MSSASRSSRAAHRAQMTLMNTEAFAITGFLSFVSNATIRRERPYVRECVEGQPDPGFPGCPPQGRTESFYSGHTGIAFTGAALSCMHHAHLPLYGRSPIGGIATCAGAMVGATTTGVLRIVADKHYASDVIVGAAIGLAAGFVVPWFHYRSSARADATATNGSTEARAEASSVAWLPAPILSPTSAGLGAVGTF